MKRGDGGCGGHILEGDYLHPCSWRLSSTECALIPVYTSGGTVSQHPSLWHLPSQWDATAVPHALLLLTVPDCRLSGLACAPSASGLKSFWPTYTLGQSLQGIL